MSRFDEIKVLLKHEISGTKPKADWFLQSKRLPSEKKIGILGTPSETNIFLRWALIL